MCRECVRRHYRPQLYERALTAAVPPLATTHQLEAGVRAPASSTSARSNDSTSNSNTSPYQWPLAHTTVPSAPMASQHAAQCQIAATAARSTLTSNGMASGSCQPPPGQHAVQAVQLARETLVASRQAARIAVFIPERCLRSCRTVQPPEPWFSADAMVVPPRRDLVGDSALRMQRAECRSLATIVVVCTDAVGPSPSISPCCNRVARGSSPLASARLRRMKLA